jgi:hypothetical protein
MVDALRLDCWVENAEDEDCDGRSLFYGPTNDGSVIIRDPFGLARNPPRLITVHHQNAKNSAQNTSEPSTNSPRSNGSMSACKAEWVGNK